MSIDFEELSAELYRSAHFHRYNPGGTGSMVATALEEIADCINRATAYPELSQGEKSPASHQDAGAQ